MEENTAHTKKAETCVELQCSAHKFFEFFTTKAYLMPQICPEFISSVQTVKGDWGDPGSVRVWHYVAGNFETSKEKIEAIDKQNNTVTFIALEGDIANQYPVFKFTLGTTAKDEGCSVKGSVEYEKKTEATPAPAKYLDLVGLLSKRIENYLLKR
ncbi:hypothetical protein NMG60_11018805 [Bertholletia excelsa]